MLAHELRNAPAFGARLVNVHIGSHLGLGVAAGIERLAEGILRTLRAVDAWPAEPPSPGDGEGQSQSEVEVEIDDIGPPATLVLENSAGSGGGLGTSVDELADIAAAIAACGIPAERVGFCIDTAHAWGAGIDVATPSAIDDLISAFDDRIGLGSTGDGPPQRLALGTRLANRPPRAPGGRSDRRRPGWHTCFAIRRSPTPPTSSRRPGMDEGYDAINLARARDVGRGRPMAPLPDGAIQLRGSARARTAPA